MIGVVGLSHATAPLPVREQLYFHREQHLPFLRQLLEETAAEEAVLLSTCNRTELYVSSPDDADDITDELLRLLHDFQQLPERQDSRFYRYRSGEAVRHLFRVAAGLDSMVLGENQILGQVKEAYRISSRGGCTGSILNRLFHKSFEAGKRARSETALSCGASSVSYTAAELARQELGELDHRRVLLIGAGETGELVLQSLAERGCRSLLVSNRTYRKASYLAERYGAAAVEYDRRREALSGADILVISTASPEPVFGPEDLAQLGGGQEATPALVIDLSVPRNLPPETAPNNLSLYCLDDLEQIADENHRRRLSEAERAEEIVTEVAEEFSAWLTSLNLQPAIRAVKERVSSLRERELAARKEEMAPEEYERTADFARSLEEKWVGMIAGELRRLSEGGRNPDYIELTRRLFDGEEDHDGR